MVSVADLNIDGDALRNAATRTISVVEAFESAGSDAHEAADYVGHGGLANKVRDFADGWDIRRGKFSEELRELSALFEAIDDTFTDLDSQTASELRTATSAAMHSIPGRTPGSGAKASIDPVGKLSMGGDT